jgi:hypothetical protein
MSLRSLLLPSLFCMLALVILPSHSHSQAQVILGALKDNTLYEDTTGSLSNGAGQGFFAGRSSGTSSGSIRRGLIAFDVAGSIPAGATIISATLTLNMSQTSSGAQDVSLHRALTDWGEGTSVAGGNGGSGGPATTGDATWIHTFYTSSFWANAGGDFFPTPSASQSVAALGSYTWGSTAGMVADVQQWLNNASSNHGWILVGNESVLQTAKRFDSREHDIAANRPALTVTYAMQPVLLKDSAGAVVGGFNTIAAAYAAIPEPITQRYLIEIQSAYTPASETLPLVFSSRTGSSAGNTITIRPAPDVATEILLAGTMSSAIVSFNGADWVMLDGRPGGAGSTSVITIQNMSTVSGSHTIHFLNGATNNTLQYVHSKNATFNTTGPRNIEMGVSVSDPAGNSDNLILHCVIEGGRTGVGSSGTTANPNRNNTVRGCRIFNWGFAGVWMLTGTTGMTVDSCTFYTNTGGTTATNFGAITLQNTATFTATITRNHIYDIQSLSTSTGLVVRGIWTQANSGAGSVFTIENNMISLPLNNQNAASVYGLLLTGTNAYTAHVYYNTVRIGGVHSGGTAGNVVSAGLVKTATNAEAAFNIKNNIFINNRTGGTAGVIHTGAAISNTDGSISMDYNDHYTTAATPLYHTVWGATGYDAIAAYRAAAAPNEAHSVFHPVEFVSTTDLHLAGNSIGDEMLGGTPIPGITMDIDGDPRNASRPYMGADERPEAPLGNIPTIVLSTNVLTLVPGNGWRDSFRVFNTGNAMLAVDSIVLFSSEPVQYSLTVIPNAFSVSAGDSQHVLVEADPPHARGFDFADSLLVYSNDPQNPVITLLVQGDMPAGGPLPFPQDTVAYNDRFNNRQSMAFDSQGRLHIAYSGQIGTTSTTREIYYVTDSAGVLITKQVTTNAVDDNYPTIVVDKNDDVHIGFLGRDAGNLFQVQYSRLDNDTLTTPVFITEGGLNKATPRCAINRDSVLHFVYHTFPPTGTQNAFYKTYDLRTQQLSAEQLLTDANVTGDFDSDVATDTAGFVHIVVKAGASGGGPLRYYTNRTGTLVETPTGVVGNVNYPRVLVDKNNVVHILYRLSSSEILHVINNSSGTFGTPVPVSAQGQRPAGYHNFASDDQNRLYIVYQSSVSTSGRGWYLVHGKDGSFSDTMQVADLPPGYVTRNTSAVAARGNGRIAVTYSPGAVRNSVVVCDIFLQRGLLGITGVEPEGDGTALPSTFALMQNYPNPFNPSTTIRFSLPSQSFSQAKGRAGSEGLLTEEGSMTTLKVYDLLGREVAILVNELKSPGEYTVTWDGTSSAGRRVSSGVYLYRLEVQTEVGRGFVQTRKMVLLH